MTNANPTKKMTPGAGSHSCCNCHATIQDGSYYHRDGSRYWHCTCPVMVAAPISAPPAAPAELSPAAATYIRAHLADHYSEPARRGADEIAADYEYDQEG